MAFNPTQHQAVTDQISARMETASAKVKQVRPAAQAGSQHWYVTSQLAAKAKSIGDEITEMIQDLLTKIKEFLQGIAAPVTFFSYAQDWQEDVRGRASSVAGDTVAEALKAPLVWKGDAADAYKTAVADQTTAATQIKNSADKIGTALTWCALSGAAFYVALAAVLYETIATLTAAVVALGSLVFSWAGVLMAVGQIAVSSASLWLAVSTLVTALGTQAQQMSTIAGEAADNSAFPSGKWPSGTS